jgi:predicted house-cleaning NTP pyrophosphatase (Maf/HAM1 superfamily)
MLVLASASPARRRLLEQAAIPHRVRVSGIDEDAIADPDPRRLVLRLAEAKARAVTEVLTAEGAVRESAEAVGVVLGCDSLLEFEGEVFGKPADAAEAVGRWRRMACTPATVCSALVVGCHGRGCGGRGCGSRPSPPACISLRSALRRSRPMWPPESR